MDEGWHREQLEPQRRADGSLNQGSNDENNEMSEPGCIWDRAHSLHHPFPSQELLVPLFGLISFWLLPFPSSLLSFYTDWTLSSALFSPSTLFPGNPSHSHTLDCSQSPAQPLS